MPTGTRHLQFYSGVFLIVPYMVSLTIILMAPNFNSYQRIMAEIQHYTCTFRKFGAFIVAMCQILIKIISLMCYCCKTTLTFF